MTKTTGGSQPASKVKVAVRVRPFNKRELQLNTICVVDMKDDQTFLTAPNSAGRELDKKHTKTFSFDHCFWSMDSKQVDKFADQELVFDCLGKELLDNAFAGYNACIFAYGQTGSGKSYTMMGSHDQAGLIPRLCNVLFERIEAETATGLSFKVEVSYMEIYNEKVRDLLDPSGGRHQLRVREHKLLGPYVDGLQQLAASSAEEVQDLMSQGSKSRTVAATKMNAESSRSHAVFTLIVTHSISDGKSGVSGERVSKLSLVDLAGSERSSKTGASGARLKEGSNINKSLTTLGLVISALADQAAGKAKNKFVPYRDSTLTWILKDNLGGNSRTTMVATLSPSADNYDETLSTLRYADRAKRIVNKAVVNEDPNARIIRELREEVERLQSQLKQSESMRAPDLQDKLDESEKLIQEISQTWEEKLRKTEQAHKKRQETLEKMGISLESSGIKLQKAKCFLVNLNADPSLNELLVYYLKESTLVGQSDESDIQLSGLGIAQSHAEIKIEEGESKNLVTITPIDGARTCVNGQPILSTCRLRHGDRILWGNNHFFRVSIPRSGKSIEDRTHNEANQTTDDKRKSLDISLNESPVSYEFAQQEVLLNQVEGPVQETMMNLEREFRILEGEPTNGTKEVSGKADSKLDDEERKKYETEIDSLRRQLLELTPRQSQDSLNRTPEKKISKQNEEEKTDAEVDVNSVQPSVAGYQKYKSLKEERMKTFRSSISQLRDEVVRAQALVREANAIATELKKDVCFSVTLRIPAHNLTSNRKKGSLLCEPAIQVVRHGKDSQVWSVEKLSNRIIEMREYYEMYKPMGNEETNPMEQSFTDDVKSDPFNETEHGQVLIGVANVFLTCLIQDAPLYYPVPIISQQGQIVGKLLVGVQRLGGSIPEHMLYNEFVDESSVTESASDGNASYSSRSMSSDLRSESSLSSGMGSSVSPDPPPDSICVGNIDKSKDVSSSSLSTSSGPTRSPPHVKHKSQRQAVSHLRSRVTIIEAQGLPANLSHFVECKYSFLDCPDVIVVHSELNADDSSPQRRSSLHIHFNSSTEFTCNITEELVDRLTSNASLAIEVWGHKNRFLKSTTQTSSQQFSNSASSIPSPPTSKNSRQSRKSKKGRGFSIVREKSRSLNERWSEVTKRLQLEVVILELGENGEYEPVEILNKSDVPSIGLFQLKQGQSRRIEVNISPLPHSGTLPLICESIAAVYAGSITVSSVNKDRGLDSYQDEDLKVLRIKWNKVLDRRKAYLDKQMKNVSDDDNKSDFEKERDDKLFAQWVMLTEERNASEAPTVDNEVPGAPASWNPPETFEMHVPIIFLDINSNRVDCDELVRPPAGLDSHLPAELPGSFVQLPFVRPPHADYRGRMSSLVSWDTSLHDSVLLNRVTPSNERIYLIIKVHIRLSHPIEMDLVLRKRICVSIYKQKWITTSLMRKIQAKPLPSSGVVYEIVSHIPTTIEEEDHNTLARIVASGADDSLSGDGEFYEDDGEDSQDESANRGNHFEKYVMRATRSVDNILALDRIRQEVTLRDALVLDPNQVSGGRGTDVVSIISKRNKNRAPSSSSSYSTPQRHHSFKSATDSKFKLAQHLFRNIADKISPTSFRQSASFPKKSFTDDDIMVRRNPTPFKRSFSAYFDTRLDRDGKIRKNLRALNKFTATNECIPPSRFHSTPSKRAIVIDYVSVPTPNFVKFSINDSE